MLKLILYYLVFYVLVETVFRPTLSEYTTGITRIGEVGFVKSGKGENYNCHYSQLWCGCYSKNGGCEVRCSPSKSFSLYNQTDCHFLKDHFLSGFQKV